MKKTKASRVQLSENNQIKIINKQLTNYELNYKQNQHTKSHLAIFWKTNKKQIENK